MVAFAFQINQQAYTNSFSWSAVADGSGQQYIVRGLIVKHAPHPLLLLSLYLDS